MDGSAKDEETASFSDAAIDLSCFYAYGYGGRTMYAVQAPFATANADEGLVGRVARIEGKLYRIVSVLRQIGGPIAAGEPIGVEVTPTPAPPSEDALKAKREASSTSGH